MRCTLSTVDSENYAPSSLIVAVLLHAGPRFLLPILELQDWLRVGVRVMEGHVCTFSGTFRQSMLGLYLIVPVKGIPEPVVVGFFPRGGMPFS